MVDVRTLSVADGGEVVIQFDITLASALANGTVVTNQSTLVLGDGTVFAVSDDPNVNGQADPDVVGERLRWLWIALTAALGQLTGALRDLTQIVADPERHRHAKWKIPKPLLLKWPLMLALLAVVLLWLPVRPEGVAMGALISLVSSRDQRAAARPLMPLAPLFLALGVMLAGVAKGPASLTVFLGILPAACVLRRSLAPLRSPGLWAGTGVAGGAVAAGQVRGTDGAKRLRSGDRLLCRGDRDVPAAGAPPTGADGEGITLAG